MKVRKRLLGRTDDGLRCYEVAGSSIREKDTSFCLGSHYLVSRYIPRNEVWVERVRDREDELANLGHEIHEVREMRDRGHSYSKAHKSALRFESSLRHGGTAGKFIRGELT